MSAVDRVYDWLIDGALDAPSGIELIARVAEALREDGIPVERMAHFQPTLNPTVLGRAMYWEHGKPAWSETMNVASGTLREAFTVAGAQSFQQSPILHVYRTRRELRVRLTDAPLPNELSMLMWFRSQGFTDYVCLPQISRNDEVQALTFATRAADGFSDDALASFRHVNRPYARVSEILALDYASDTLVATYLGRHTADRVLAGKIHRGDIETLRAVIWFSDLRGFTQASSSRAPRDVIDMLNDLFDCQVPAIEKHGGEVLKFIGDGLLAIFPCSDVATTEQQCTAALAAAHDAFAALTERGVAEAAAASVSDQGLPSNAHPLNIGLALHVGEVAYGNIGGPARLDFTAIGTAVNLTARLEALASKLGKKLVVSSEFAAHAGRPMKDLGDFDLKGIAGAQTVYEPETPA